MSKQMYFLYVTAIDFYPGVKYVHATFPWINVWVLLSEMFCSLWTNQFLFAVSFRCIFSLKSFVFKKG